MEPGGEQSTRLDRLESDIGEAKTRLANLETEVQTLRQGASTMQTQLNGQDAKLDRILLWVDGANKVAGVAVRHWKTALKFGLGFMLAYGVQNPHIARVVDFTGKFFGV